VFIVVGAYRSEQHVWHEELWCVSLALVVVAAVAVVIRLLVRENGLCCVYFINIQQLFQVVWFVLSKRFRDQKAVLKAAHKGLHTTQALQ
jgi:hypothetical protein